MNIQTVDEPDMESASAEITGKIEETKGLGPEIISCKVIYPGINKDQCWFHEKDRSHPLIMRQFIEFSLFAG